VTCIVVFFRVRPALAGPEIVKIFGAGLAAYASGSANQNPAREKVLQKSSGKRLKALGAGGGTRTPTTFVTGT
jgi:hypothetical protein